MHSNSKLRIEVMMCRETTDKRKERVKHFLFATMRKTNVFKSTTNSVVSKGNPKANRIKTLSNSKLKRMKRTNLKLSKIKTK